MNKITILEASDRDSQMVVFSPQTLKDLGIISNDEFKGAQYFMVTGDQLSPEPGLYRIKQVTQYNIFAYLVMEFDLEDEEE